MVVVGLAPVSLGKLGSVPEGGAQSVEPNGGVSCRVGGTTTGCDYSLSDQCNSVDRGVVSGRSQTYRPSPGSFDLGVIGDGIDCVSAALGPPRTAAVGLFVTVKVPPRSEHRHSTLWIAQWEVIPASPH